MYMKPTLLFEKSMYKDRRLVLMMCMYTDRRLVLMMCMYTDRRLVLMSCHDDQTSVVHLLLITVKRKMNQLHKLQIIFSYQGNKSQPKCMSLHHIRSSVSQLTSNLFPQ